MISYSLRLLRTNILYNKLTCMRYLFTPEDVNKSSLFISGERAKYNFVVVVPHLDFDKRFENYSELEENLKRRRLEYNLSEMRDAWNFLQEWYIKKQKIFGNLNIITEELNELKRRDDNIKNMELNKLSRHKDFLTRELQKVKNNVWEMEETVIYKLLQLPNIIHPETPENEEVIFAFNNENLQSNCDHLIKGKEFNCLDYNSKDNFYLKNKAALFELAVTDVFVSKFSEHQFVRFSNPDFARTVLAEGVCINPFGSSECFLLENTEKNSYLHLCGGASIFPFCGFHAKRTVPIKSLPVKYVASGRHYSPAIKSLKGLYSVCQSTSVQIFIGTFNDEEMYNEYQSCIKILIEIFSSLGLDFRIVKQPPHSLKSWESLLVSFQVYAPFEKRYVEVGKVSLIDDFVSKRLKMCYLDKKENFLKVVSGTVINSQALIALCLERSSNELFIPAVIQSFMIR